MTPASHRRRDSSSFPRASDAERFAVYRNNVAVGLIGALRSAFPAVDRLVGEDFFNAMARTYVRGSLPHTPVLLAYGSGFADFIDGFRPARSLPYLSAMSHGWNGWWLEAYHAEDAAPLGIEVLQDVGLPALPDLRLLLHPSVRLVRLSHPALEIWRVNIGEADLDICPAPEDVLIVRPQAEVAVLRLTGGAAALLSHIDAGHSIGVAIGAAIGVEPDLPIAGTLQVLFAYGVFCGFAADPDGVAQGSHR